MKKLSYEEKKAEIRKPIYLESAKILWDKTYDLYKYDFKLADIVELPSGILFCLDKETVFGIDISLFDIINLYETNQKTSFLNTYFAQLKKVPEGYKPYIPEFLENNLEIICQSTKLNELMVTFKEVSDRVGKDLLLLIDEYIDETGFPFSFLFEYAMVKKNKKVIKERGENGIRWRIKSRIQKYWNDEDIVLDDMAFVWTPFGGYSRFLDKNSNWGFLDVVANQRYYMPENVNYIGDYVCERAVFEDKNSGLYGYVDYKGIVVIEPKYANATDFMWLRGDRIAVVEFTYAEKCKMTLDPERKDFLGYSQDMGITIFNSLVTIDANGNLTPDLQKKYEEELNIYREKIRKEESKKHSTNNINMFDCESDDDIIDAIEGGYGDVYGF